MRGSFIISDWELGSEMTTAIILVDFCIYVQYCWSFTLMRKPVHLFFAAGYWSVFD